MNTETQLAVSPARNSVTAMKLNRAKAIYRQVVQAEGAAMKIRETILRGAFELGQILNELKEEIGHGNWYLWLNANFQELGRTEQTRQKNAERCMTLYNRNQNRRNSTDLEDESVRKFMWGYIPVKERTHLSGDRKDAPQAHYLTFVNNFWKWDRQLQIGQGETPSVDVLRRELEQTIVRIKELCGAEWVNAL